MGVYPPWVLLLVMLVVLGLAIVESPPARAEPVGVLRPVPGQILTPFREPDQPWTTGHRGLDLAVTPGEAIRASRPGRVVVAGMVVDRGWVTLDHGGGLTTTYGPIELPTLVRVGDQVRAGAVLGLVPPGVTVLHWGARIPHPTWSGHYRYLHPLSLAAPWTITLNPMVKARGTGSKIREISYPGQPSSQGKSTGTDRSAVR